MFKQGQAVEVINNGWSYTTYVDMAIQLGADVDARLYDWYTDGANHAELDRTLVLNEEYSWVYNSIANNGDICIVLRQSDESEHVLIERIKDNKQFVIGTMGLRKVKYKVMENKWFGENEFFI